MKKEGSEMIRNKRVSACSLLWTVGLALAVAGSASAVQTLPIVQFSTSTIANGGCSGGAANTAIDVSIDPNGFVMAAFVLKFSVVPSEINLVSVAGATGITASGGAGGSQFSFGATFSTNQTTSFPVGTITVQGCVGGGQMVLTQQTYTDGDFNDTDVTTAVIAATVAGGGPSPTPTNTIEVPLASPTPTPTQVVAPKSTPTTKPAATATATKATPGAGTATPTKAAATSTLSGDLTATATTITLADASSFPNSGTVLIGSELISYTGKSGNQLTGATRGVNSTTATTHSSGAPVSLASTPATCPTCEDDDGCQIGARGHGGAWLLLIPAIGLLVVRRRSR